MPEVVRVRVVDVGERVQVDLEHLVARASAFMVSQLLRVPAGQRGHDLLRRLVGQLLLQVLGAELLPPELAGPPPDRAGAARARDRRSRRRAP